MFYSFFANNAISNIGFENLFRYVSFRAGGALLTAFLLSIILGNFFIKKLSSISKKGQPIREKGYGPESHLKKTGTPTMGGLLIVSMFTISTLLWTNLSNAFVWIIMLLVFGFCFVGFFDDFMKLKKNDAYALSKRTRIILELIFATIGSLLIIKYLPFSQTTIFFPFFKNLSLTVHWSIFLAFAVFVIIAAANAVNITDGLDGLSSLTSINVYVVFLFFAYVMGRFDYSMYLHFHHIPGASELVIVSAAMIGALFGFLWFNCKPAQIFMGDTGSLALGAGMAGVAIILKSELILAIAGFIFVAETLSSAIQIISLRKFNKKVFLMAPLHHHFELKGMPETKIVFRFWMVSILFALIALSSLKIR